LTIKSSVIGVFRPHSNQPDSAQKTQPNSQRSRGGIAPVGLDTGRRGRPPVQNQATLWVEKLPEWVVNRSRMRAAEIQLRHHAIREVRRFLSFE
jgi:hypothetical protein